jgi:hypothetical protein
MGGGTRYKDDVRKAPTLDLKRAVQSAQAAAGPGGTLPDAAEFCSRVHRVAFASTAPDRAVAGAPIRLELREGGLEVVLSNELVGVGRVDDARAGALTGCLNIGFVLEGSIESVDPQTAEGEVIVTGVQAGPS